MPRPPIGIAGRTSISVRAIRLRNLLLLVAVFATLVCAGCWSNRSNMQRVLDQGYSAIVQITGAQQQWLAPVAFDGWRPRFVEQALSVDLKWDGKDGKPHTYRKVPVTEAFANTIVSGNEVRLAIVPAKVMDEEGAVPVINADAGARFAALQDWVKGSGYVALVAVAGFAVMALWFGRSTQPATGVANAGRETRALGLSPRLTLFGVGALILGAIITFHGWSAAGGDDRAAAGLIEATADLTLVPAPAGASGGTQGHRLLLAWTDAQGAVHHFGPLRISDGYWAKISRDGVLTVKQARIRYRGDDPQAAPVLVDDQARSSWRFDVGLAIGVGLMAIGTACLISVIWSVRRRPRSQTR